MNSIKLTSLLLLLLFTISENHVTSAQTTGFNVLSQNLTIIYNALERIQWNPYGNLVEDVILVSNPNPRFDDEKLVKITYFLYTAKQNGFDRLYPNEKTCLLETLAKMPSSTLNLITKSTVCFKNVDDGSYLATYIDSEKAMIRILTSNYYTEKHNIMWSVSGDKTRLQLSLANNAFMSPQFSNFLYIETWNQFDFVADVDINIGLSNKDAQLTKNWVAEPKGDIVSIKNVVTEQFLCSYNQNFNNNYRYAKAIKKGMEEVTTAICQWNVVECNYKEF